jgi:predicted phosphodiesterase
MSCYPPGQGPLCPVCQTNRLRERISKCCQQCARHPGWHLKAGAEPAKVPTPPAVSPPLLADELTRQLKRGPAPLADLAVACKVTPGQALDALLALRDRGANVCQLGERWSIERTPALGTGGRVFEYTSRPDHTFKFGLCADKHFCSKYHRRDVVDALYRWFADEGVDRVIDCGNWIDGERDLNRRDIEVFGLEPQLEHLAAEHPKHPGIVTYAVHGDDHEGWFGQREAVDMGRACERTFRDAGREDWIDLGFMEGRIELVNADSGMRTFLLAMHPGGGSAYAHSYKPQKIVESLQGGEKPAVLCIGHYHKLFAEPIRNVWALQAGCTQDQTPFLRKKGIEPAVGGMIVTLEQDPRTGAIIRCLPDMRQYFVRAYYNDRWSKTHGSVQPDRDVAA